MNQHVTNLCKGTQGLLAGALAGIPADKLCDQSKGQMNHPLWVAGHLTIARAGLANELGVPVQVPANWSKLFGRGSTPTSDPNAYPSLAEVMAVYNQACTKIAEALPKTTPDKLAGPHGIDQLRPFFGTLGDLVVGLGVLHDALHIGQITVWRQMMGFSRLMG